MTYHGTIRNGQVVIEEPAQLPEGTRVEITLVCEPSDPADDLFDLAVPTGIRDLAAQHDHYLYGVPKQE